VTGLVFGFFFGYYRTASSSESKLCVSATSVEQMALVKNVSIIDGQINHESLATAQDFADATRTGGAGNLRYTWKANDKEGHFEYLAIAKGKDQRCLNRYAVKRLGVSNDEDERD
jgi:hypothetical protein